MECSEDYDIGADDGQAFLFEEREIFEGRRNSIKE